MRWVLRAFIAGIGVLFCAMAAVAEESGKFRLDGATLIYNTENPGEGEVDSIESEDIDHLLRHLRAGDEITTLELNSGGGSVWAANRMKQIIIDFGLDTHVHGICESSCVTVFLGGEKRTMSLGSVMGFHQIYWSAPSIESYYERNREDEGWDTPFEFAEWMYLDTQDEIYEHLSFMIERGVDPKFAIKSIRNPGSSMWRPYRITLLLAGVLTE
ncbi:MAG: hypothetical protein AB3N13_08215 [Arenibacterium sp.]